MENVWLRHKAGMKQRPCNVFMVELLNIFSLHGADDDEILTSIHNYGED